MVPNLLDDRMNGHFRSLTALIVRFQAAPIPHRHGAISCAIAAATTCAFLPAALSRRWRAQRRTWAFQVDLAAPRPLGDAATQGLAHPGRKTVPPSGWRSPRRARRFPASVPARIRNRGRNIYLAGSFAIVSAKTGLNTKAWNDDDFLRLERRFARKQPTAAVMLTVVGARDTCRI